MLRLFNFTRSAILPHNLPKLYSTGRFSWSTICYCAGGRGLKVFNGTFPVEYTHCWVKQQTIVCVRQAYVSRGRMGVLHHLLLYNINSCSRDTNWSCGSRTSSQLICVYNVSMTWRMSAVDQHCHLTFKKCLARSVTRHYVSLFLELSLRARLPGRFSQPYRMVGFGFTHFI